MSNSGTRTHLRQRRIMSYFVEAADEIIKQEGLSAVTTRKVADKAGYTSATLYNYFDNLNHLIFIASMTRLIDYYDEVNRRVKKCKNPMEVFLTISECFCEYSFRDPELYSLLFFDNAISDKVEVYTQQYYELFPVDKKNGHPTLGKMVGINNIYNRSLIMVMACADEGYFTEENARDFNEIAMLIFRGILKEVREGTITATEGTAKNMKYYRQLMGFYANKKLD